MTNRKLSPLCPRSDLDVAQRDVSKLRAKHIVFLMPTEFDFATSGLPAKRVTAVPARASKTGMSLR